MSSINSNIEVIP